MSNVDETLGEMFLEEKTPTEADIKVGCSVHSTEMNLYITYYLILAHISCCSVGL